MMKYQALLEVLTAEREKHPAQMALVVLKDDGTNLTFTHDQLYRTAARLSTWLEAAGIQAGDVVIMALPHGPELMTLFWALTMLKAVPCISHYPRVRGDQSNYVSRIQTVVGNTKARALLTLAQYQKPLYESLSAQRCIFLGVEETPQLEKLPENKRLDFQPGTNQNTAFLMHTSGTTGSQKGVSFTQHQVLEQALILKEFYDIKAPDRIVHWLPLHHDLGIFLTFMLPLVASIPVIVMSPSRWVARPGLLFQSIHEFGGTISFMPNFAYNHCVRGITNRQMENVRLDGLRVLVNTAEPIRSHSIASFYKRFSQYGLKKTALKAGYGLTEAGPVTLDHLNDGITVDRICLKEMQLHSRAQPVPPGETSAMEVVSSGMPLSGMEMQIVAENNQPLPERSLGEITLRSDTIFEGYYRRPDLTKRALRDGWFHTGDFGYMADGRLFICGRRQDIIIASGRNIYPEDLEDLSYQIPGIYPGRTVAFGIEDTQSGTEGVVLVCELRHQVTKQEKKRIEQELRKKIFNTFEVAPADIKLLDDKGWVIKTAGGKVARSANREKYIKTFLDCE
ncbi:AMP-binding protein [candidate division CSSED10-310 bacterium]|uniref:AMP-binding protein n=1 Tax=candidate division CSSED10-310 bacterium TaxID=2855610 RepID=A0ABV6YTB8_UNCC1